MAATALPYYRKHENNESNPLSVDGRVNLARKARPSNIALLLCREAPTRDIFVAYDTVHDAVVGADFSAPELLKTINAYEEKTGIAASLAKTSGHLLYQGQCRRETPEWLAAAAPAVYMLLLKKLRPYGFQK
jgi:hypothetical protein